MNETFNQIEYFTSPAHPFGHLVQCQVQVFEEDNLVPVVVFTELEENPGASVTNAAEFLAEQAKARFLGGREAIYVEHYPQNLNVGREETFDRVEFETNPRGSYCKPKWTHLGQEGFNKLINGGREL